MSALQPEALWPIMVQMMQQARAQPRPSGPDWAIPAGFLQLAGRKTEALTALLEELAAVDVRLGTSLEGPNDLQRAQRLAHQIKNHLCVLELKDYLASRPGN